jgi:hypothetical protein
MTNSQPTQSINETKNTKTYKSQGKQQTFLQRIITVSFAVQATLICVRGNLDVLSGKSPLDVIPSMLAQGIELILKAQRVEKSLKESDRKSHSEKQ